MRKTYSGAPSAYTSLISNFFNSFDAEGPQRSRHRRSRRNNVIPKPQGSGSHAANSIVAMAVGAFIRPQEISIGHNAATKDVLPAALAVELACVLPDSSSPVSTIHTASQYWGRVSRCSAVGHLEHRVFFLGRDRFSGIVASDRAHTRYNLFLLH